MQDNNDEAKVLEWWKDEELKSYFLIVERNGTMYLVESKMKV